MTFKVIQGHYQRCHSIGHIRFPVSLPLQLCLYLAPLTTLSLISQHLKRSRDYEHIPFGYNILNYACTSTSVQHKKFELPSCTKYKDIIGAKFKKGSRDPDNANNRGSVVINTISACDRRTDTRRQHIPHCIASRGKNAEKIATLRT